MHGDDHGVPGAPALVATSPWQRCRETAQPIAAAAGLEPVDDPRLGYDGADLEGWVIEARVRHRGRTVVAVSHGDLIPEYLVAAGLAGADPPLRVGSMYRLDLDGGARAAVYVDRDELRTPG